MLLILLIGCASGCGGASGGGSSAPASSLATGTLTGRVVAHPSDDPNQRTAAAGIPVGVYTKRVRLAGPLTVDPPSPIARTTTGSDGSYRVTGLAPGRYYVTFGKAAGTWVRMPTSGGATANGVVCTDCPLPL
jgi:hypothetical protein